MSSTTTDYKILSAEKLAQQREKIPEAWLVSPDAVRQDATNLMDIPTTCGILSDVECDITSNYDATALLEKLKAGTFSAEQVTVAFCKRAAIAHQLVNCLTEIFFDKAIERARELDAKRRQSPPEAALPPLFGLPISLKDSFDVLGVDTSTGLGCYVNEPAKEHSSLAALLLDLGAVLYCKTNLPQSIMAPDSHNNIFGRTLNPRNTHFTAGGSTGGEGALIALRGSILGVGTDIGGSVRVPSVCNGLYGFRPSVGLVPHGGVRDLTVPGTTGVMSTAGPMATSLRDCSLFLRTVLQAETWRYDSSSVSLPWNDVRPKERLRIGLVEDDGMCTPSPPVRRGLKTAADRLRETGRVEIIPLTLPNHKEIYLDLLDYFTISGPYYYKEQFDRTGEPLVPSVKGIGLLDPPAKSLGEFFELNVRRAEAAKTYLKIFRDNDLDGIMMPGAPHTAVPHDTWTSASYTGLWNYLDYPAIIVPVDKVREDDAADDVSNAKFGEADAQCYSLYTGPGAYKDLPVCVQLVGYRHADEALLNMASVVEQTVNGNRR
ncbi:putative fatty-acid amide hydrolase [Nemania sp. NC0429]|nr:putative fatty-acid amide hydrolase [Nemania sp. NC0429]